MRRKLLALYMRHVMRATWWHYFTADEMSEEEAYEFAVRFFALEEEVQ